MGWLDWLGKPMPIQTLEDSVCRPQVHILAVGILAAMKPSFAQLSIKDEDE